LDFPWYLFIVLFSISILLGRGLKVRVPGQWITALVVVLVFTISFWGGASLSLSGAYRLVWLSLAYSLTSILLTYAVGLSMGGKRSGSGGAIRGSPPLPVIASAVVGLGLGRVLSEVASNTSLVVEVELILLAVMVGLSIGPQVSQRTLVQGARLGVMASLASILGSAASGLLCSILLGVKVNLSLGIAMGMGWYTLDGPLIASASTPSLGLVAFLSNFLREQLTFLLVPVLRGSPISLIAMGGATTMDDTLPLYVGSLGESYGIPSVVNGVILTILVPIVVPIVLL
jgi:uncharacterized membrane protein YbjE (DUF340 family)